MADTLRELVVRLSLDSGSFSGDIKSVNTAVKQAEANFKQAGAGVDNFEKSLVGAKAKVEMLTSKLTAQNASVDKHKAKLDANKKALEDNQKQQTALAEKIEATRRNYETQATVTGKNSKSAQALASDLKKLEGQQAALEKQSINQARAINTSELALTNAETAAKGTAAALKTANKEVEKASTLWGRFGAATEGAQKALAVSGQKLTTAGRKMTMGLTLPIVAAGTAALKTAIDWESAFAGVQKTVDGTDQQMKALHDGIIDMSKVLPTSAVDIAKVAENAGQLGIQTDSILGFSRVMIDLGETTNLSADQAAIALAQFANITQMSQSDFDRLGATIVDLGNNYATTEADIVSMATRLAGAGKQVKMSEANILAISAAMSSVGIEAEMGGSAMSKVMLNIDMAAAKGGKEIAKYAKVSGLSAKEFTAAWKADPARALSTFVGGLSAVEKSGGNVAMTLEELGYKEVRTRDALLRLTGASEIMSSALGTANTAWSENVALANEAEKRYGTNASKLQMLKNQAIATGISFGNAMTPHLEAAMGAVSNIVEGFGNMSDRQKELVLTTGAVAAGIGPVLNGMGKLATSGSVLLKAFSGPAGWITLAVGALAGLGVYLATLPTDAEKVAAALGGITFKVTGVDEAGITQAINDGVNAAKKEYEFTVSAKVDLQSILDQLDLVFADNKMAGKEYKQITKLVNDYIAPDIKAATEELKAKVDAYQTELDRAVNAEGQPLTEDQKKTLMAEFIAKNSETINQLQAGKDEVLRLLDIVKAAGSSATAEQIAELEAAIAKVLELRAVVQAGMDEAIAASKADYNLTVTGGGNEKSAANATGYVAQTRANEIAEAEATKQAALSKSVNDADAAKAAYIAYDEAVAAANAKAQSGYEAIAEGMSSGTEKTREQLTAVTELNAAIDHLNESAAALSPEQYIWAVKAMFGEGKPLSGYVPEGFWSNFLLYADSGDEVDKGSVAIMAKDMVESVRLKIAEEIAAVANDPSLNPLKSMLQMLVDAGAFDAIDPTTVQGPLLDMLKLVDLVSGGKALGEQVPEGMKIGINSGAETSFTKEELQPVKTALENAVKDLLEIHSPAAIMIPLGKQIPAGLAKGIVEDKGAFVSAITEMYEAGMAEANKQEVVLRNHLAWLASTRSQGSGSVPNGTTNNTTNNSTNTVNVSATVRSETDAKVLAAQIEGINRRSRAGYGAI